MQLCETNKALSFSTKTTETNDCRVFLLSCKVFPVLKELIFSTARLKFVLFCSRLSVANGCRLVVVFYNPMTVLKVKESKNVLEKFAFGA